jgi:uncharacterized protein (TIGR04255 family)
MPVSFPSFDHIPLRNSPLKEVICQVRFPFILKIAQGPTEFQEAIRDQFPNYQAERALFGTADPSQPVQTNLSVSPTVHRFLDRDNIRAISLAPDFYAISTAKYVSWQAFMDDLRFSTEAVLATYHIQYSTRIGLRYINVLNTSNTKTGSFPEVLGLLRPELTALLEMEAIQEPYLGLTQLRTRHEDSIFSLNSGIVEEENKPEQMSFVLDFDLYTEGNVELHVANLMVRCDHYHTIAYNAFRWCILPDRLTVFEPVE